MIHLTQLIQRKGASWAATEGEGPESRSAQLVLVFGDSRLVDAPGILPPLRERFPEARIVLCSGGGEIIGDRVLEDSTTATALRFDATEVRCAAADLRDAGQSGAVGEVLGRRLAAAKLRHVLVFAEGLTVNGSGLADGLARGLPEGVTVSGGLAADGERFARTLVGLDEPPVSGRVVAVGLYGDRLHVGMSARGGWEPFGPSWLITRSEGNLLLELDGAPALPAYKRLIGAHAYALPSSGLLYPLRVERGADDVGTTRTLLGVDEGTESLTFAGDVPVGARARPMRAHLDRLIDAAGHAARESLTSLAGRPPQFALLVSCIGRKLLLQRRVEEEIACARSVFGAGTPFAGFYSYGELSPTAPSAHCGLHNQTMTVTTLAED